jgi:hypothetical protein
MPSRTDSSFIAVFSKVFLILRARDYQPALNVMDNKCSKVVEKHIQSNKMNIQLVPPHNHHVNAAEGAIATFKKHFVATLATVDMPCPLQLWDEFLPQVKRTLNLNKMPLAPLGTKALVYKDPTTRASWAPHATDGFVWPGQQALPLSLLLHPVDLVFLLCGHVATLPCPLPSPCCI